MDKGRVTAWMGSLLSRRAAAMVIASAVALQPCFSFVSQAYQGPYGYGYGYGFLDDAGDYYYDEDGERVYLTNVTKTYEDGTRYMAEYRYDSQKRLISADIKREDGDRITESRQYAGDRLASISSYYYDASAKEEMDSLYEFNEQEMLSHSIVKAKYPEGAVAIEEEWYQADGQPIKNITVDRAGVTEQTDYAYDGYGNLLTEKMVSSDGSMGESVYQYDGSGKMVYQKIISYDSATQTTFTKEGHYGGDEPGQGGYTVETVTGSDGREHKTETWRSGKWGMVTKQVTTNPDGSQIIEEYTYDSEGNETLYVKSDGDGMMERRETTVRDGEETTVSSDRDGNSRTVSYRYDERTNQVTYEVKDGGGDGSYSYMKYTYDADSYSTVHQINRERTADGKETYSETTYNEEGQILSVKTRYPDGTEGQISCEYDESGNMIRDTEVRGNGISAVTQYQINEAAGSWQSATRTFSNGYQMTVVEEEIGAGTTRFTFSYSAGEVAQDIVTMDEETTHLKTIYHDGRTEEVSGGYDKWEELMSIAQTHFDAFSELAWGMQTVQTMALPGFNGLDLGRGILFDSKKGQDGRWP